MKDKPDIATLMDYLYGELDDQKNKQVEAYLKAHPDMQEELDLLRQTRQTLSFWKDQPVAPPLLFPAPAPQASTPIPAPSSASKSRPLKWWTGIAATLLILLMTASWSQVQIRTIDNEVRIQFGAIETPERAPVSTPPQEKQITPGEVRQLVANSMNQTQDSMLKSLTKIERQVQRQLFQIRKKQNQILAQQVAPFSSDSSLIRLTEQLKAENYALMAQMVELSGEYQEEQTKKLFQEFSDYLELQRETDLQAIQTAINNVITRTDAQQFETDLLLTQLFTQISDD